MTPYRTLVDRARRRVVVGALALTGGNVTHAARRLGIQRTYLHRLIRRLGVRLSPERGQG